MVEELYLNNHKANKHENLHVCIFFSWRVHCLVIFSLTHLLLVLLIVIRTMHYMETENETNVKICIEILLVVCATCCYIFVKRPW